MAGQTALASTRARYVAAGTVDTPWLKHTFAKAGAVIAEAVRAAAECGSFNFQLLENAFEVGCSRSCSLQLFGVDLLLSHPAGASPATLAVPDVTLLEFNAGPDVVNSGEALRPNLAEMFEGIVRISVAPFFGRGDGEEMALGEDRWGWRMVGKGEVRGNWR